MNVNFSNSLSVRLVNAFDRAADRAGDALYKLGTGKRINSAMDGALDSAQIQRLDAQARGIREAAVNVNDTQGLTTTAMTALDQLMDLSYSLRELAQKATDESLTSTERNLLSEEASGLIEDYQNIVTYTEFNNTTLLDNSFGTKYVQVGPNAGDKWSFAIGDARASTLGKLAVYSGTQGAITNPIGGNVTFNGVTVASSLDDGLSTSQATNSAISIVNAINSSADDTNVYAEVVATTRSLVVEFSTAASYTGSFAAGDFRLNGVSISGAFTTAAALATSINANAGSSGVKASLSDSNTIVLTADDGRNIQVQISAAGASAVYDVMNLSQNSAVLSSYATLSQGTSATYIGAVRIWSSEAINIGGTNPSLAIGIASGNHALVAGTEVESIDLADADAAQQATKVLDATIAQISTLRAEVGAVHSRLDENASFLLESENAVNTAKSAIEDVDFVMETTNYVVAQLLQDASLASLIQANLSGERVAKLLEAM